MRDGIRVIGAGLFIVSLGLIGLYSPAFGEEAAAPQESTTMEERAAIEAVASPVNGTTWSVKVIPDEQAQAQGEKASVDTLIFDDGTFTSTGCLQYGFSASPYTVLPSGDAWSFRAEQVSKQEGQTAWFGTLTGDAIAGTMVWTTTKGSILNYHFEGARVIQ